MRLQKSSLKITKIFVVSWQKVKAHVWLRIICKMMKIFKFPFEWNEVITFVWRSVTISKHEVVKWEKNKVFVMLFPTFVLCCLMMRKFLYYLQSKGDYFSIILKRYSSTIIIVAMIDHSISSFDTLTSKICLNSIILLLKIQRNLLVFWSLKESNCKTISPKACLIAYQQY